MAEATVRWVDSEGQEHSGDLSELDQAASGRWHWVDLAGEGTPEALSQLASRYQLHPLTVEDVEHSQRRPKIDIFPAYLFFVWITPRRREGDGISSFELDVVFGKDYLLTVHREPCDAIDTVAGNPKRALAGGPDWVLHAIVDLLVDSALPMVDQLGEEIDGLEDSILDSPDQGDLAKLHQFRRQLTRLRRIAAPERDILHALARERDVVSEDAYRYFLDVGDHVSRLIDSIETYQDVAASVMDVYLSAQNNRMNEIMKQLTVVATIFMPLTLMSGIYGMNLLRNMWPPPLATWSFPAVVLGMFTIALAMIAYFRRRNWW